MDRHQPQTGCPPGPPGLRLRRTPLRSELRSPLQMGFSFLSDPSGAWNPASEETALGGKGGSGRRTPDQDPPNHTLFPEPGKGRSCLSSCSFSEGR